MQSSSNSLTLFTDKWLPVGYIGEGSTCQVVLATNLTTQSKEAIKLFKQDIAAKNKELEARLVLSLSHPRILKAIDYVSELSMKTQNKDELTDSEKKASNLTFSALALEYAPHGDLLGLLSAQGPLSETLARTYFHQMVDAIEYLHTRGICHLDIKSDNVLLDENYCVKLSDFGLALELGDKRCLKGVAGTTLYLSPEMHLDLKYDGYHADLFALGITLFTMVSGIMPFKSATHSDSLYKYIAKQDSEGFWKKHEGLKKPAENFYSQNFKDLIQGMLALEPKKRLTLEEIKNHAWFNDAVYSDEEIPACIRSVRGKAEKGASSKKVVTAKPSSSAF
jgi:serine/threonine protein kinase